MRKKFVSMLVLGFVLAMAPAAWGQGMGGPGSMSEDGLILEDLVPLAKSIVFPGSTVVSSRPLVAAGAADKSFRDDLDLQVSVLELENGVQELRSRMTPRLNATEEITISPDLVNGTYTVAVTPVDREALVRDGLLEAIASRSRRADVPQKIFGGGASCKFATLISRHHTGPFSIIRATTIATLEWRWFSDGNTTCLDTLTRASSCSPGLGMFLGGCNEVGTNDGTVRASQTTFGSYNGAPPGSVPLVINTTSRISVVGLQGTVFSSQVVSPSSEENLITHIADVVAYSCARPHR